MKSLLVTCKHQLAVQQLGRQCHRRLVTAGIASACATARQDGEVGQLQDQLSQSMAAPGQWVPADWQWRPTWVPELALPVGNIATCGCSRGSSRTEAVAGCRGAGVSDLGCEAASEQPQEAFEAQAISENNKQQAAVDPTVRLVAAYTSAIASLERPKIALAAAKDSVRMSCYRAAIHAAVPKLRPGAHVLVLGHSSALLALLVAEAGVGHIGHVTAIEQCPLSYRAGCLLLAANRHLPGSDLVSLEPARLGVCALGVQEEQGEEQAGCSGPTCTTRKTESRSPSAAGTTCCTHTDTAATAATSIPFRFGNGTSPSVDGTPTATAANTQDNSHSDPGSSCEASHHDSPSVHHIKASRPADLVVTDLFDHRYTPKHTPRPCCRCCTRNHPWLTRADQLHTMQNMLLCSAWPLMWAGQHAYAGPLCTRASFICAHILGLATPSALQHPWCRVPDHPAGSCRPWPRVPSCPGAARGSACAGQTVQ